jgi:hypothetical protein
MTTAACPAARPIAAGPMSRCLITGRNGGNGRAAARFGRGQRAFWQPSCDTPAGLPIG